MTETSADARRRAGEPVGHDVVIVGAGFAGLYALHKLRGLGLSALVIEAGTGVGGTWFWNRYPGARVDIESQEYSFSFSEELEKDWHWQERYAGQPELERYLNHVADRFDLRRDIRLGRRVTAAHYDEAGRSWVVTTDRGERIVARFCVMATGPLSVPKETDIAGASSFAGQSFHTGRWPGAGVDFAGKVVGVIGTGSSAVQTITEVARQAKHLYVFQRTPNYSVPAHNRPASATAAAAWRENLTALRAKARASFLGLASVELHDKPATETPPSERARIFEDRWQKGGFHMTRIFSDTAIDPEANAMQAGFVASKIHDIVKNPKVADALTPKTYPIGTKRLCIDTGYYETFNRDNVTLVDVGAAPIERITPAGIRTADGDFALDILVFALGFDAITGAMNAIDIRGRGGARLREKWDAGGRSYLGLMIAGFPNLFTVNGPGSPSVFCNMVLAIEQHVDWIADCLVHMRDHGMTAIEADEDAEAAWVEHVGRVAGGTLMSRADSWYLGANIVGKPRLFMPYLGGLGSYRKQCDAIAAEGYRGFRLSS